MTIRSRTGTHRGWAVAAAVLLILVACRLAPVFVLNLGALYLRDLVLDSPSEHVMGPVSAEARVPWVVREMPLVASSSSLSTRAIWLVARTARLLEYRGASSRTIGCAWNPRACTDTVNGVRLSAAGHAALARAYADGRLSAGTPMEAEIMAWSCLTDAAGSGDTSTAQRCQSRLAAEYPVVAAALSETAVVFGEYVDELNESSGARLGAALASRNLDCRGGLGFLRRWIRRDGFQPAQFAASASLAGACPGMAEAQFYLARAADVGGRAEDAGSAYARSEAAQHPEAAFWQADFLARHAAQAADLPMSTETQRTEASRLFDAAVLPARLEDGTSMTADTLVVDEAVARTKARRASSFGAVLAHGPYVRLPYGRYRVSFFVRAGGARPSARTVRLDVREDSDSWRPYVWSRIVLGRDVDGPIYRRFDHEFTSTGEGTFSIAVVALTRDPVFFERVEVAPLGRE